MRILVVQETDWIDRNPILHHRMLESLGLAGDAVLVLDYDILWRRRGRWPLVASRRIIRDVAKFHAGSGVVVIRPAMLRVPGLARPTWLAMMTIELLRAFRSFRPDVVVAYGLSNALVARVLAAIFRVPYVFHIFDSLHALADPAVLAPVARRVEQAVLRSARVVIVAHRALIDYVRAMGVRRQRLRLILNGFETRTRTDAEIATIRARLGIADDEIVLLFVGWLYRHSAVLEIARQVLESNRSPGYRLVVAGDGDLLDELRELAATAAGGERLIILGKVPVTDIPDLIAAADIGLNIPRKDPAMRFIVPAKVDEYLELGRPVLATRLAGMLTELGDLPSIIWIDGPEEALPALDARVDAIGGGRAALRELGAGIASYAARRADWTGVTARFRAELAAVVNPTRAGAE